MTAPGLLALLSPHGDALVGDLLEEHADLAQRRGPAVADRWMRGQLLSSLGPLLRRRMRSLGPALVAAAACAILALAGCAAFWRLLLSQVPLRASHPAPGWFCAAAAVVALLPAALGFAAGRALDRTSRRVK